MNLVTEIRSRVGRFFCRRVLSQLKGIVTHLTEDEKIKLYLLAHRYISCDAVAVEVGSYYGASSVCIAVGMGQKCRLYCVDSWQNDAMSEGQRDTYEEFLRNTKECSDRIIPLRGESTAIAASFGSSIALLFLDGDHSYEGVKADVDAWWPKLRPGGIMAMHDIGWAEGVQRVVSEFIMPNSRAHGRLPNLFWATKIS